MVRGAEGHFLSNVDPYTRPKDWDPVTVDVETTNLRAIVDYRTIEAYTSRST